MKKMWTMIIIGIVLIVLGAGALTVGLVIKHAKDNIMDGDGMIRQPYVKEISFTKGGGMEGGFYSITWRDFTVTEVTREGANAPEKTRTAFADYDVNDAIYGVINDYKMTEWKDLPLSDLQALDAPTSSLSFVINYGPSIRFSDNHEIPKGGWEGVEKILKILQDAVNK